MKTASISQLLLMMLIVCASVATAKEKLLIVVQKSEVVSNQQAQQISENIGKMPLTSEKYEMIAGSVFSDFFAKNFDKTESAIPADLVKLSNKTGADKLLAVVLMGKNNEKFTATVRLIDAKDNSTLAYNKIVYEYELDKFSTDGIIGLVEPVLSGKSALVPEVPFSLTTNDQIKLFVDRKRVKDTYFGNLSLAEGFHEIFLQREDGYIVDKKNVYFSEKNKIEYDYNYTPKSDAVVKSLILPGWGQFSTNRVTSGSIYATAAVGSIALLGYGVMSYNQSKSDFDDAKIKSETAVLYKDRLAYADQANGFRDDCSSASTLVYAGAAALAATYIVSVLDIYLNTNEHDLKVKGNNLFSGLQFNGNALSYNFPVNTNSEKHNPNK